MPSRSSERSSETFRIWPNQPQCASHRLLIPCRLIFSQCFVMATLDGGACALLWGVTPDSRATLSTLDTGRATRQPLPHRPLATPSHTRVLRLLHISTIEPTLPSHRRPTRRPTAGPTTGIRPTTPTAHLRHLATLRPTPHSPHPPSALPPASPPRPPLLPLPPCPWLLPQPPCHPTGPMPCPPWGAAAVLRGWRWGRADSGACT